jgi:hypothetical protein
MQQMFLIEDLIACSTCFGHLYANHQELDTIIQLVAACGLWYLVFKLSVRCGAEGCVSGLCSARLFFVFCVFVMPKTQNLPNLQNYIFHLYSTKYHRQQPTV